MTTTKQKARPAKRHTAWSIIVEVYPWLLTAGLIIVYHIERTQ